MKLMQILNNLFTNLKESLRRFPISLAISTLLVILLIMLNEGRIEDYNFLIKLSMVTGLAIPISILIKLVEEVYLSSNFPRIVLYLIGGAFLLFYYIFFLNELKTTDFIRYTGSLIFFILACTFIQKLKFKDNYENYIIRILSNVFITGIYCLVLYLGIAFILFTMEQLFEIVLIGSIYYYVFLGVIFIFGLSIFLSKYPNMDFKDSRYPKALKILLLYILIPLISLYSLILYVYFLKIIVTWQWPSGLVSHLVIWYSTISVFLIFFIMPLLEENQLACKFKKFFPIFNIPILLMMFFSIGQRISQYGFTENRYYILLLGIWILIIMIYFIIKKRDSSIFVIVSLAAFVLISIFGPLSSFSISKSSQNKRLNELLYDNNILSNGVLSPNQNVSQEDKGRINNILLYFNNNHGLDYVESLPHGYDINNMEKDFGFAYEPYQIPYNFFHYSYEGNEALDISDYDFYIRMNSWQNNTSQIAGLHLEFDTSSGKLTISGQDKNLIVDIKEEVKEINKRLEGKSSYGLEDLSLEIEEVYNIKIIFTNISGNEVSSGNDINLGTVEFILLLYNNNY